VFGRWHDQSPAAIYQEINPAHRSRPRPLSPERTTQFGHVFSLATIRIEDVCDLSSSTQIRATWWASENVWGRAAAQRSDISIIGCWSINFAEPRPRRAKCRSRIANARWSADAGFQTPLQRAHLLTPFHVAVGRFSSIRRPSPHCLQHGVRCIKVAVIYIGDKGGCWDRFRDRSRVQ